jgi:hypothetical protein
MPLLDLLYLNKTKKKKKKGSFIIGSLLLNMGTVPH